MYLVYYPDGSFQVFTIKQEPKNHMEGAKIFQVEDSLTVADVSEVNSGNGWQRDVFPARLLGSIKRLH